MDTLPEGFADRLKRKPLEVGSTIAGKYRLTDYLGEGAMGQVFLADNTAIGLHVAVKVLKADLLANPEFRNRFQQEAQMVAAIEHPNVARFFDLVIGDPTFLVMEYVRGPTLEDVLGDEQRLAPDRAIAIARRIAWGLDAAHAVKVIHRDLKPANVVLAPDREHGELPKVIDFGLAKLAQTAATGGLTRTGQIVGTPLYMAPEQIEGRAVDARTDIYALGCLLFQMLTGRTPFADVEEDVQILYRQLHETPRPPSAFAPELPRGLDEVVLRCLEKSPARRYASMQELASALDDALPRKPSSAMPAVSGTHHVTLPAASSNRGMLALAGAAILVVGMVAGVLAGRAASTGERSGEVRAGTALPPPPAGLIMATTTPPGATLVVDGKPWTETTPTVIRGLAPGEHHVDVTLDGHMPIERFVTLGGDKPGVLDAILQPSRRSLVVRTVPAGAVLYLDDRLVSASTPATVTLSEEEFHTLRAEKLGFESGEQHVVPEDRAPEVTIVLDVEKSPQGYIAVDADTIASVWIDGTETGFETPSLGIRVPVGLHTVEIVDGAGKKSAPAKVNLRQGETVRLKLAIGK